jgi:hypothetical protein
MRQFLKFAAALPLLVAAACSDVSTSPDAAAGRSLSAGAPAFDYTGGGAFSFGDLRSSFIVSPRGGSFSINGLFNVNFPAGSICDPELSTYGDGEWDNDCVTLTRSIRISSTVRLRNGKLAVDFQPALRFSPSSDVTISTSLFAPTLRTNRFYFSANPSSLRPLVFSYAPSLDGAIVADYVADPTLVTHVDLTTGRVWRRVKHFSGYVAGTGHSCTVSADNPDCVAVKSYTP